MPSDPDNTEALRHWTPSQSEDIAAIWDGLAKKYKKQEPTFRSRNLTDQEAGWLFERLVIEAFRLEGLTVHHPFRITTASGDQTKEQYDGLVVGGWQGFLVECKFTTDAIGIDPIFRLHLLVEQRLIGTIGLFFSAAGYTPPALESSEFLKPIRVLLFDRPDLEWGFGAPRRMREMIRRKWRLALKHGKPHIATAEYKGVVSEDNGVVAKDTGFSGEHFDGFSS